MGFVWTRVANPFGEPVFGADRRNFLDDRDSAVGHSGTKTLAGRNVFAFLHVAASSCWFAGG